MKLTYVTKALFLGTSSLLLFACGNDEEPETDGDQIEEPEDQPSENEDSDYESDVDEDENASDEDTGGQIDEDENDNEDEDQGQADDTDGESEEEQVELSELVYMSDEEREAHHRNLAVRDDLLWDEVFEYLMLPGIHENTVYYEARVAPDELVLIELPDAEELVDRTTINPYIAEDGHFSIDLGEYDFAAGEAITIRISGGYPQEQTLEIPIHEAREGMEEVRIREISEDGDSSEHTIGESDTLESVAYQYGVNTEELQGWNGIFDPAELETGMTINTDGPNEEQAQKEEWQIEFEQSLYDNYGVTVSEYEDIGDGYYGVYVNEHDTGDLYYVTVDSNTGDYSG